MIYKLERKSRLFFMGLKGYRLLKDGKETGLIVNYRNGTWRLSLMDGHYIVKMRRPKKIVTEIAKRIEPLIDWRIAPQLKREGASFYELKRHISSIVAEVINDIES